MGIRELVFVFIFIFIVVINLIVSILKKRGGKEYLPQASESFKVPGKELQQRKIRTESEFSEGKISEITRPPVRQRLKKREMIKEQKIKTTPIKQIQIERSYFEILKRIDELPVLKKAVVLSDIISPPKSLRD